MRFLIPAVVLLVLGALGWYSRYVKEARGELRCEGAGSVVINIAGKDYAVNGMASTRYPSIERIWNSTNHPDANTNRILNRGLTLCDW